MSIALGYGRKSVVRRDADTITVDKQRLAIAELADRRGESLEWYEDAEGHRSGRFERTRPGFQRLLARLQNDKAVRSVIFYELDRAARSVMIIDKIIKLCHQHNVAFICIKDGIDTSRGLGANEITRIQMLAVLAEGEANRVSERMVDIARYYRDSLKIPWGMWPFGFARTGEGERAAFVPRPPHDDTARRLLTLYANGLGYRETARQLNQLGYYHVDRHGRRKAFNTETARAVVGNVLFYAGYAVGVKHKAKQAKIVLEGDGTYLERYARAMRADRSPAITPLIDETLANAVIERRFKSQSAGRRPLGWVALLTPIAYWRDKKLWAQSREYGHFYRSRGQDGARFDGERLDGDLLSRLRGVRFPAQMRTDIRRAVEERLGASQRAELQRQEAKLLGEIDLLIDLLRDGMIPREVYNGRYAALDQRLSDVRRQMSAPDDVERVMDTLSDLASALDLMTPVKRKQAIQHIFERVDVGDSGAIERLHLREWARMAFKHLAAAVLPDNSGVSIMPPVSTDHVDDTLWLIRKAA